MHFVKKIVVCCIFADSFQSVTRRIKDLPLNNRPVPETVDIDILGTELKVRYVLDLFIICLVGIDNSRVLNSTIQYKNF